jgi:dTDP-4-dehydrorhamnose reductase
LVRKKNILVTGSDGQLGKTLKCLANKHNIYNFYFKNKSELDISNFSKTKLFINHNNIDIIINCAAYTDVENSEINFKLADLINHLSVDNLAFLCKKNDIQLIHISTDFVFDGKKSSAYHEDDRTNPLNIYGETKLKGENKILKQNLSRSIILRTSWLYSNFKGNFVNKVIENLSSNKIINMVNDEIGSPTSALDLAEAILKIIPILSNETTEIYHYANSGCCSRFEFASKINELIKGENLINPVNNNSFKFKRPSFSCLDNTKISKAFNLNIKDWSLSLEYYFNNYNFVLHEI